MKSRTRLLKEKKLIKNAAEVGESKTEIRENKTRVRNRKREMRRAIIRELKKN